VKPLRRLVVIGDALLDLDLDGPAHRLAPDAPMPVVDQPVERARPGGAALAAALAAGMGVEVTLICALGDDEPGRRVAALLGEAGVALCDLVSDGATPEKVRVHASGTPLVRLDRGGAPGRPGPLHGEARSVLDAADAVLVSDYGRGVPGRPDVRAALGELRATPIVWDPHPRGPAPVPGATLVTPNAAEASPDGQGLGAVETRARALAAEWRVSYVAVTLGARGAVLAGGDAVALAVPAAPAAGGDPCGAGDCFAATAAAALARGALPSEAVTLAVGAASAFVAAGGATRFGASAGAPRPTGARSAAEVAAAVRARGGTVVATGGCFDLLHAGHVRTLQAARALGDCLIVLLNSDASVARLKGPERPLVEEADRAAVLEALGCVDAVLVFDEDDPRAALETIRPDLWAKGGDYAVADLPEVETLAAWGGRAVVVPYVAGRSTTRLIEEVVARAG
jgi:rfaE bifunctional protein nucleotidyltransferase chain/domain/rfaE bifunctional protein kinase chain/domain